MFQGCFLSDASSFEQCVSVSVSVCFGLLFALCVVMCVRVCVCVCVRVCDRRLCACESLHASSFELVWRVCCRALGCTCSTCLHVVHECVSSSFVHALFSAHGTELRQLLASEPRSLNPVVIIACSLVAVFDLQRFSVLTLFSARGNDNLFLV